MFTVNAKDNYDTSIIDKKSVVFFLQDSTEIDKRKHKTNEEELYVRADDAMYYLSVARTFIGSIKLLRFEQSDKQFIKCIRLDKTQSIVKISQLNELCGVCFFTKKQAKLIDLTNLDEGYKQYFDK